MENAKCENTPGPYKEAEGKRPDSTSSKMAVQYKPLLQSMPSDEEDVVEFSRTNNEHDESGYKHHEVLQLRDLKPSATNFPRDSAGSRRRKKFRRNLIVIVLSMCAFSIAAIVAAIMIYFNHEFNKGIVHDTGSFIPYGNWQHFFNHSGSTSTVTLIDVDGDGLEDVLIGVNSLHQISAILDTPGSQTERCQALGFRYPCMGQAVALRGYDGKELWRTWLHSVLLFVYCDNIDVNGDNKADCILTGRQSMVQAVDLATGHIHWVADASNETWSSYLEMEWNTYRVLSMSDVNGDEIKDLLIVCGGNQSKEAEDHDRAPGRVMIFSGATGKPLGYYVELPNSRETYMSPVRHVTANGSSYILLGSGGETISGDLMIVSEKDLQQYILADKPLQPRTLFKGAIKGVMISPILVDMTNDATPDILLSGFEGVMILFDGETLQQLWKAEFPAMESYSTPAPGHFDDDDVLDFMVMWGSGEWEDYEYAIAYIVSGRNGSVLWQLQCQMVEMYSSLTLKTAGPHDLFLFRTMGREVTLVDSMTSSEGGGRIRRHFGSQNKDHDEESDGVPKTPEEFRQMCYQKKHDYEDDHLTCTGELSKGVAEVLLMDKNNAHAPLLMFSTSPVLHRYTVPGTNRQHCHSTSPKNRKQLDMCVVRIPRGHTGAVGDVDGDGEADLVELDSLQADTIDDMYEQVSTVGDVIISRLSLADAVQGKKTKLVPMSQQPWRQFMGSNGDNVYRSMSKDAT